MGKSCKGCICMFADSLSIVMDFALSCAMEVEALMHILFYEDGGCLCIGVCWDMHLTYRRGLIIIMYIIRIIK